MSGRLRDVYASVKNAQADPAGLQRKAAFGLGILLLVVAMGTKSSNVALCGVLFAGLAVIADTKMLLPGTHRKEIAQRVTLSLVSAALFLFGLSVTWLAVTGGIECTPRVMKATGSTLVALTLLMCFVMRHMLFARVTTIAAADD
jgi:hypothetical protein